MPTTSSYYSDLEHPTVNQDGSTWGSITNTYIDGLATKLRALSDRINAAGVGSDSDLSQILRDISQYENINSSIPITVKSLFGITDLKAADTYSYASAWNATYDSYLSGFSLTPPQSSSAVQSFDYDLFVEKLQPYVDQAESNITQANADIAHVNSILYRLNTVGRVSKVVYQPFASEFGVAGTASISPAGSNLENVVFTASNSSAYDAFATAFYNYVDASSPDIRDDSASVFSIALQMAVESDQISNILGSGVYRYTVSDLSNTIDLVGTVPSPSYPIMASARVSQGSGADAKVEFTQNRTNVTTSTQTFSVNLRFRVYTIGDFY